MTYFKFYFYCTFSYFDNLTTFLLLDSYQRDYVLFNRDILCLGNERVRVSVFSVIPTKNSIFTDTLYNIHTNLLFIVREHSEVTRLLYSVSIFTFTHFVATKVDIKYMVMKLR